MINIAHAQEAGTQEPSILPSLALFAGLMLFVYFLMWRPQAKRNKAHKKLLETLKAGDEVLTTSGIVGKINKIEGDFAYLEIANNTIIKVQRAAISLIYPKMENSVVSSNKEKLEKTNKAK